MMTQKVETPVAAKTRSLPVSYCRFWIVLTVVLLADQVSKLVIVHFTGFVKGLYPPFGGVEIVPGFFNLVYAVNYGAAWGMLEGYAWLLIALAFVVLALIAAFRHQLALHEKWSQLCFGLVSGGILGNTIDRIFRGHVVDFLDFHLPMYRWPTFNLADSAIVAGTFLYMILQFRQEAKNRS